MKKRSEEYFASSLLFSVNYCMIGNCKCLNPVDHDSCKEYRYNRNRNHSRNQHSWHDVLQDDVLLFFRFSHCFGTFTRNDRCTRETEQRSYTKSEWHVPTLPEKFSDNDGNQCTTCETDYKDDNHRFNHGHQLTRCRIGQIGEYICQYSTNYKSKSVRLLHRTFFQKSEFVEKNSKQQANYQHIYLVSGKICKILCQASHNSKLCQHEIRTSIFFRNIRNELQSGALSFFGCSFYSTCSELSISNLPS